MLLRTHLRRKEFAEPRTPRLGEKLLIFAPSLPARRIQQPTVSTPRAISPGAVPAPLCRSAAIDGPLVDEMAGGTGRVSLHRGPRRGGPRSSPRPLACRAPRVGA